MDTGITYDDIREEFGLIPEFEEREAAFKAGYKWEEWLAMDTLNRADHVAHFRLRVLLDVHVQDASNIDAERRRKKGRSNGS